jgi:hypothetical protein
MLAVPVIPGHGYTLRFTFSEVWWAAPSRHKFDITVGGAPVLTGIDPFALAGDAKFAGEVKQVNVTAAAALLAITMVPNLDNAIIAALEVSGRCQGCSGSLQLAWQ